MIYVLAFPRFDPKLAESIKLFRSKNEPERARLVPPHITLVFGLTDVDPEEFTDFCRSAIASAHEIQVEFDGWEISYDPFENKHKIFLTCSIGADSIMSLHLALYQDPHRTRSRPGNSYRPHMTIATNASRDVLEAVSPASIGEFPICGTVDTVDVVRVTGDELQNLATIPLGN